MKFFKLIFIFLVFGAAVIFSFSPSVLKTAKALIYNVGSGDSLSATAQSQSQIYLSWTLSYNYDDYEYIYKCSGSNCTPTYYTSVASQSSDYYDSGLSCGTTYGYQVCGAYGCTNTAYATTDQCTPGTPTIGTASPASQTSATVTWTRNSPYTETGFEIYDAGVGTQVGSAGAGATSGTAGGQSCNTTNAYEVRAYVTTNGRTYYSSFSAFSNNVTTDQCTPGTPTIGTASPASQTSATVTWTRNSPYTETGFQIESSPVTYTDTAGAGATSGTKGGLACNTSYSLKVRAYVNTNGRTYYSSYSNYSNTFTTDQCTPAAPTNFSATPVSQTQIDMSWTDNSTNESGFEIKKCTGECKDYSSYITLTSVGANIQSYSETGLSCNSTAMYYVRSYVNTNGRTYYSDYSNIGDATTDQCTPGTPTIGTASPASQTSATVTWTRNSPYTETDFEIDSAPPSGTGDYANAGATSGTKSGLICGSSYSLMVRACVNTNGRIYCSNWSNYSNTFTTDQCTPGTPTIGTASPTGSDSAQVTWTPTSPYTQTGFYISVYDTYTGNYLYTKGPYNANATSAQVTGLPCNDYYLGFEVFAYVYTNTRTYYSNNSARETLSGKPTYPCTPSAPSVSPTGQTSIYISWSAPQNGASYFNICQNPTPCTYIYTTSSLSYTDTNVSCNSPTNYALQACNSSGCSSWGPTSNTVTTDPCTPNPPTNLTATPVSSSQINLNWTDQSNNETGFDVYRNSSLIATTTANTVSYSNTGLATCTSYSYNVDAYACGNGRCYFSTQSNTASTSTLGCNNPPNTPTLISPPNNSWTNSRQFSAQVSDPDGGSVTAIFVINGTAYTGSTVTSGATSSYTYSTDLNNVSWYAYARDPSNATSSNTATWIAKIDTVNPNVSLSSSPSSWTNSNVTISVSASDNASGIKTVYYRCNTSDTYNSTSSASFSYTCSYTGGQTAQAYAVDNANNQSGVSSVNYYIDKTAPTISAFSPSITPTNSYPVLNFTVSDTGGSNLFQFELWRAPDVNGSPGTWALVTSTQNTALTSLTDNTLTSDGAYWYGFHALDAAGNCITENGSHCGGVTSDSLDPRTSVGPDKVVYDTTAPTPNPPTVSGTALSSSSISWTISSGSDNLSGLASAPYGFSTDNVNYSWQSTNTWTQTGLSCFTNYTVYGKIKDAAGNITNAGSNTTSTSTLCPPTAPTGLSASGVSETQINLAWADNSSNETGFKIERKTGAAGTYSQIGTAPANTTSYNDTGLAAGTIYYYRVKAYNSNGDSSYSNEANANSLLNAPSSLSGAATSPSSTAIYWTDNSSGETGFKIERKTGAAGTYSQIGTAPANTTSYNDTGLTASTVYYYRVRAYTADVNSSYSNEISITTLYAADTDFITDFPTPSAATGTLTSSIFDTTKTSGATLNSIIWQGTRPNGTCVKFQIAVSNTSTGPWEYKGCNSFGCTATTTDYYGANCPEPNTSIPIYDQQQVKNQRYLRYKVFLTSNSDRTASPVVNNIILNWSP